MPFARRKREPEPETSAAMDALPSDRWRAFVSFYLLEAPRMGAQTHAARRAGFGKPNSPDGTFQRMAHRLMSDPRIQRAVLEEARKMLRGAAPEGVNALLAVVRDPRHRDHIRGVDLLLSRTDAVETHSTITHQVAVNHDQEAVEALRMLLGLGVSREKLIETFGYSGLGRYERMLAEADQREGKPAPPMIEGEATDVTPSGD